MPAHPSHPAQTRLVACPECYEPAEVVDQFTLSSTDGPLDHVKVRCAQGHWFALPADSVVEYSAARAA
jgi:hypothetical protein